MSVTNVLAGVAVRDLPAAIPFYARLLGSPGQRPMPEVCEWTLPRGGCLQLFEDSERAGRSSVTFAVIDMDRQLAELRAGDIEIGKTTNSDKVRIAIVHDPDGNQIVFAQALSDTLAR